MKPQILVPYDFSPAAEQALRWAQDLKQSVGGGSIRMLFVLSSLPAVGAVAAIPFSVPCEEDLESAEAALRDVAARIAPDATVAAVLGNDVASHVVDDANANGIDLIVMGTHGRGGVKRMLLGSVADYAVRNARCPVVTVRSGTE
jgi:nucleotide-binding universal stress UspA family protein